MECCAHGAGDIQLLGWWLLPIVAVDTVTSRSTFPSTSVPLDADLLESSNDNAPRSSQVQNMR